MELLKKIRVFFDQDFEAVRNKIPLEDMMKKVLVDIGKIIDRFDKIKENVDNFFEEVIKKDEDYKALMAKYEIENENLWFLFAFSIYKAYLCERELRDLKQQLYDAPFEQKQH